MEIRRRAFGSVIAATAIAFPAGAIAQQPYPSRPVRLVVGLGPGSAVDALARQYAARLSDVLGTSVIVENRAGAGQIPAVRALQLAAPDGYTLYMGTGSVLSQGPGIRKDLPYEPLKAFSFVAEIGTVSGMIYAHPDVPVRNVAELIAYAKAHPNELSYSSSGVGSAGHLCAEYFQMLTGTRLRHIPYKSDPEASREVAAGTVNMVFGLGSSGAALAEANKLRGLMVIGSQRTTYLPAVPHAAEVHVPGLENIGPYTYYGIVAPAGLPAPIVDRLNRAFNQVTAQPEIVSFLSKAAIEPTTGTPAEFQAFVEKEIGKWRKVGENVKIEY